jgi:Ser-tRNA(Ala) deacylase AlaX
MSKLKKEELETLKEQESKKIAIFQELGAYEAQKHSLLHLLASLAEEQNAYKNELEETYGKISVNLEDGSFEKIEESDGGS